MKMTTEEAFVKMLQMHGIEHAFGIIGSAFMPISDLFPKAGIKFWDCAHEGSGGMMADGYTRACGKMSMMIAQNGPGITNFVGPLGEPVPLSRAEVAKLVSSTVTDQPTVTAAAAEEKVAPTVLFELGEIVKVMSGPLSDFDGEITEINVEQQKLKVLVSIFERQVPVELPYDQVQKV